MSYEAKIVYTICVFLLAVNVPIFIIMTYYIFFS